MSRLNRSNFLDTQEVNNKLEKDLVMHRFDLFKIKRSAQYYTIRYDDIQRPDLLSLKLYGKVDYYWIIGMVNSINDWWNDLIIGEVIIVPDILDIEDFLLAARS